jgi:hypothetical protein
MSTPFDALKTAYPKEYIDIFDMTVGAGNPLRKVTPILDDRPRFLPMTCNILVFTAPPVNSDGEWDSSDVNACKALIIAAYEKYTRYEVHAYIQGDSDANSDPDNADALSTADGMLAALEADLGDYGFTYHGILNMDAIVTDVNLRVATYYTETN